MSARRWTKKEYLQRMSCAPNCCIQARQLEDTGYVDYASKPCLMMHIIIYSTTVTRAAGMRWSSVRVCNSYYPPLPLSYITVCCRSKTTRSRNTCEFLKARMHRLMRGRVLLDQKYFNAVSCVALHATCNFRAPRLFKGVYINSLVFYPCLSPNTAHFSFSK